MKRVILLNGPPQSGKDCVAGFLRNEYGAQVVRFSTPIKAFAHARYGLVTTVDAYEHVKDESCDEFDGRTPRSVYIEVGNALRSFTSNLGVAALAANIVLESHASLFVIPDCGFPEERDAFKVDLIGFGLVASLVRVTRPGCDFSSDSRRFLAGYEHHIHNDGSLKDLMEKTSAVAKKTYLKL